MEYYAIVRQVAVDDGTSRYASVTATEYTCPDGCFVRDAQKRLLDEALGAVSDNLDDIRVVVRGDSQVDLCVRFCGCAEQDVTTAVRFSRRDVPSPEDLRI